MIPHEGSNLVVAEPWTTGEHEQRPESASGGLSHHELSQAEYRYLESQLQKWRLTILRNAQGVVDRLGLKRITPEAIKSALRTLTPADLRALSGHEPLRDDPSQKLLDVPVESYLFLEGRLDRLHQQVVWLAESKPAPPPSDREAALARIKAAWQVVVGNGIGVVDLLLRDSDVA